MTDQHVQDLVKKFFRKKCSQEEREELARWIDQSSNDFVLRKVLEDAWREHEPLDKNASKTDPKKILSAILGKEQEVESFETSVRPMWIKKIAVAAVIASFGGYRWVLHVF